MTDPNDDDTTFIDCVIESLLAAASVGLFVYISYLLTR